MNRNYISIAAGALVIASYGFLTYGAGNERDIRVPQQNGTRVVERLNLEDEEPFTYKTFDELIQEKRAKNLPYIIARVETENHHSRYYDAHELNEHLFGIFTTRPFNQINEYRDMMTTLPIARIDYFITNNNQEFQYFCSFNDLVTNTLHWMNLFYANQLPEPNKLLEHAYNILLTAENEHRDPTQNEYRQAREWFELIANQQADPSSAAEADVQLAGLYRDGSAVPVDRAQARTYFLRAAQQTANIEAAINAYTSLGNMYNDEAQQDRDLNHAKSFYAQAVHLADWHHIVSVGVQLAHLHLGEIYKYDENTPERYAKARIHFERAIEHAERFSHVANMARIELADMAFRGPEITGVSYDAALRLYQAIVDDPQEEEAALKVQAWTDIGRIYYFNRHYQQAAISFGQALAAHEEEDFYTGMADYGLGEIYFHGQGQQQNYNLARQHFERVLANPYMQEVHDKAQEYLNQIGR